MKKYLSVVVVLFCIATVKSQDSIKRVQLDDVVVTGNKIKTQIEKSGKTIFKLDQKTIEANRGKDITDLLNEIPGVQIDGNFSTPGTNINYRIRGANSEQALILIDGIPFNDSSSIAQTFDLRMLDLNQVESIEVLKGGLSTLYGTGAAAGIINIKLKESAKKMLGISGNVEYGSFNTSSSNVNVSGNFEGLNYMISASNRTSDGFSAALDTIGNQNFDDDDLKSINFLGRLGYKLDNQFSIGLLTSIDDLKSGYDRGSFRDNDSETDLKLIRAALSPKYQWEGGSLKGNFSYHTNKRVFNSPSFSNPNNRNISEFNGNTWQSDIIFNQSIIDQIEFVGGINFQRPEWKPEDADSEIIEMLDPYASVIIDYGGFNFQIGGRLNIHSLYGSNFVWNANPSYLFNLNTSKLKLLGSYATAFLSPSLNQLYAGDFGFLPADAGNPDLEPQESETAEVGFEWFSKNKFSFGGVYFYRKDNNLIEYVSGKYLNIEGKTEVEGVELNASLALITQLKLTGHYTYTHSITDGTILRRVPKHKFGFNLSATPIENLLMKITHLHVGEVPENDEILLDPYHLFDFFTSYTFKQLTVSGGINNIFDADYVDRYGWATAKRNYNIGIRYNF